MASKLENYLRTYRRRAGLSQGEIALLLGTASGTRVARYERFNREPGLHTALAFEIIFHAPAEDLFAGLYDRIEREVRHRAELVVRKLEAGKQDRLTQHKLAALRAIMNRPS